MSEAVNASGNSTPDGAQAFVAALEALRVEVVFGLPGVHNLAIWKTLSGSSIRLVGVRHEQTAAYAADGYARATGRLGVALVTTGPGAANTLGATGEAWSSGSPILVVATDIPNGLRRPGQYRGVLHEMPDQASMFANLTKELVVIETATEIGGRTVAAGRAALATPTGPVYLGIPTDLLSAPATAPEMTEVAAPPLPAPSEDDLAAAVAMIASARSPLIWAGGGALQGDAGEAVGRLAELIAAPVLTTYASRGLLRPAHPCLVPGPVHLPEVGSLWDEADLVIAIGTRFDGMMTQNWLMPQPPKLLAINVDAAAAETNYPTDLLLIGDARAATEALTARAAPREGLAELEGRLDRLGEAVGEAVRADDPCAAAMLETLAGAVPASTSVVADMCIPGYWIAGFHLPAAPRRFSYPVGWGTLGFGFPAAIGAAVASRTLCVCGDGGFMFAAAELATIVQERLPLTVLLVDDGGYGMLKFDQTHAGEQPFGVDLHRPDWRQLVGSFGLPITSVTDFGEPFAAALADSLVIDGPNVLVVEHALRPPPTTSPRWYRRG